MSKKRNLSEEVAANTNLRAALLIAESVSIVIEAVSRFGENQHCLTCDPAYAPYGVGGFDDLQEIIQKAISKARSNKESLPPYPPLRKYNNNTKENNTRYDSGSSVGFVVGNDPAPSPDELDGQLKINQKKIKVVLPAVYFEMVEREEVPDLFVKYARKKGMCCELLPIFTEFVLYHSKKNTKMANWYSGWQTWVRNQIKWSPDCLVSGGSGGLTVENLGDILEN